MRILVLYKPNSEHGRIVEDFIRDFKHRSEGSNIRMEILNAEGREGSAMASIYDVFVFPSIMVLQDDGSIHKTWEGTSLPLIDDVKSYALA